MRGVYERGFWVLTFKSVSVPWRAHHPNKDPYYGENYSLTHFKKPPFFFSFEKDWIYLSANKGIVRVSPLLGSQLLLKTTFNLC